MNNTYTYHPADTRRKIKPAGPNIARRREALATKGRKLPSVRKVPFVNPRPRRLPTLLRRAWFGLNQTFRRLSAEVGLTPDQFTVLRTLSEHEPAELSQRDLAGVMASDANTIAALLTRMERSGLIERLDHPADGRAYHIALKSAGRAKFEEARPRALGLQGRILAALPESRRDIFLQDLETIANACQRALNKAR